MQECVCPGCAIVFTRADRVKFMVHLSKEHDLPRHEAIALVKEAMPSHNDDVFIRDLMIKYKLNRDTAQAIVLDARAYLNQI